MKQEVNTKGDEARICFHKICDSLNVLHGIKVARAKDDEILVVELQDIESSITDNLLELMRLMNIETKYR